MEHRLITGGAHYLPFARHRLKAMRGTGLQWATERYDFGDGQVEIRLCGAIEYIKLEGGGCTLRMDSGVVTMHQSDPWIESEVRYGPGTLRETESVRTYNGPFVAKEGTNWRTKPGLDGQGQITGDVTGRGHGVFKGRVPQDNVTARSFAPRSLREGDAIKEDSRDDGLVEKKICVRRCPASMFTGRCRLFVQAVYGTPRNTDKTDGAGVVMSVGEEVLFPLRLSNLLGQPSLYIQSYREPGGEPGPEVWIGTGTGVHLDPETGRHWLLNPGTRRIEMMPLKGSPCAESMRRYLRSDDESALSADDKEHLEAYILSTCRPVVKDAQSVEFGTEVSMYSMGYGWHWNWSGLAADIVINDLREMPFENGFNREGMRSTHYRIEASLSPEGQWHAGVGIVEGPNDWSVSRGMWSISEPNWVFHVQEKSTPRYSSFSECDAPFYAFYVRDELKVGRVKVTKVPTAPGKRNCAPAYFAPSPYGTGMRRTTLGLLSGWGEDTEVVPEYYVASFQCGAVQFGGMRAGYRSATSRLEISNKEQLEVGYVGHYNDSWQGTSEQQIGYPTYGGEDVGFQFATMSVTNAAVQAQSGPRVRYDETTSVEYQAGHSLATMIVPFYDAEALFFHAERSIQHERTNKLTRRLEDGGFVSSFRIDRAILSAEGGLIGWDFGTTNYLRFIASDGLSGGTTIVTPSYGGDIERWVSDADEVRALVGHGGAVPARMLDLYYYHDASDYCSPVYSAWSGVRVDQATVISPAQIDPVGTQHDGTNTTLVGWV